MSPPCQADRAAAGWLQAGLQQLTEAGAFLLAHSLESLTGARPPEDGVPEVVEVGEVRSTAITLV